MRHSRSLLTRSGPHALAQLRVLSPARSRSTVLGPRASVAVVTWGHGEGCDGSGCRPQRVEAVDSGEGRLLSLTPTCVLHLLSVCRYQGHSGTKDGLGWLSGFDLSFLRF